jgi:hypothetical protein
MSMGHRRRDRRLAPAAAVLAASVLVAALASCGDDSLSTSGSDSGSPNDGASGVDGSADATDGNGDTKSEAEAGVDAGGTDGSVEGDAPTDGPGDASGNQSYTTKFPLMENPISEGGHWINGGTTGLDWGNVQTTPGLAFGTVVSLGPPYNDSTAVLTGTWGSDQTAQATVHIAKPNSSIYEEVELRLRTTVTAHKITGYEFNFRCTSDGSQYAQIVRWNGALNDFTYVNAVTGPGLHDGDVIKATAVGSTLTSYINGVQQAQGTDTTFPGGSPGVGFYNQGGTTNDNADYGFSSYTAAAP